MAGSILGSVHDCPLLEVGNIVRSLFRQPETDIVRKRESIDIQSVSNEKLRGALGQQKVNEAAANMGTDENTALDRLRDALPGLLDNASSGGSLNGQSGDVTTHPAGCQPERPGRRS